MSAKLTPLLPRCHTYVEPFGGGASMLFAREPSPIEVYNDLDSGLVGFFRVLADPAQFEAFHRRVGLLPCAREIYEEYMATWAEQTDPVERAARWFVVARQSFGGRFNAGWRSAVTSSRCGMAKTCSTWLSCLAGLPDVHARLARVQIEHADYRVIFDRYDTPDTLFYVDPPYAHGTRSAVKYAHELTDADHDDLVDLLLSRRGMVALSAYETDLYAPLADAGWHRREWQTACYAAGRTRATGIQGAGAAHRMQSRTEVLWRNPACVAACGELAFND